MTTERPDDTIFALSSGQPPAAIAIVRISGPSAERALEALAGSLPPPRRATLAILRHRGEVLDRALVLRFPGPASATGEDLVEMHLHGGRAVVAAVLDALGAVDGLRPAAPGEFTRRAFDHGRLDLAEAEGLADLLAAETQSQRRAAQALAGGALSRAVEAWQQRLLHLAAALEALLDFSDEGDVEESLPESWSTELGALAAEIEVFLARPPVERLRDGVRVVIGGPPNAGKSSLLNVLAGREAAITSPIPGTTRDLVEAPTAIAGAPILLVDTAGLRESDDHVETIGVERAERSLATADLIIWLGAPEACPDRSRSIIVRPKADLIPGGEGDEGGLAISSVTGEGISCLVDHLVERVRKLLPAEGDIALNARHREALAAVLGRLGKAREAEDPLIVAEYLRQARISLDLVTGRAGVDEMLDALFGRFCIGK